MSHFFRTKNHQCHAVKPWSQIGETPQQETEFNGIDKIFNEEQTTQFSQESVNVSHTDGSNLLYTFSWQHQFNVQVLPVYTRNRFEFFCTRLLHTHISMITLTWRDVLRKSFVRLAKYFCRCGTKRCRPMTTEKRTQPLKWPRTRKRPTEWPSRWQRRCPISWGHASRLMIPLKRERKYNY